MFTLSEFNAPRFPEPTANLELEIQSLRAQLVEQRKWVLSILRRLNEPGALSLSQLSLDMSDEAGNSLALPETSWTPAVTFQTAGDLSVDYSGFRNGMRIKFGSLIYAEFNILTSTFTHTTASGSLQVTGLTDTAANDSNVLMAGSVLWDGITKANYTQVVPFVNGNDDKIQFAASGSGQAASDIVAADMPTAGTVRLRGFVLYRV